MWLWLQSVKGSQRWCCPPEVVLPARGGAARLLMLKPTLAPVIASSTFINVSPPLLTDKHEHHVVLWSNPDVKKNWRASFKYPGPPAPTQHFLHVSGSHPPQRNQKWALNPTSGHIYHIVTSRFIWRDFKCSASLRSCSRWSISCLYTRYEPIASS